MNQQQGYQVDEINASAVAAVQALSLPLSAYSISGTGNRSKLPFLSLVTFSRRYDSLNRQREGSCITNDESSCSIDTRFSEVNISQEYSWLSRQLRAIAVLSLTTTRQVATSASLFMEAPMAFDVPSFNAHSGRGSFEVLLREHRSTLVHHTILLRRRSATSALHPPLHQ